MADLSDVEDALVALIAATLYPNGTLQPSVANAIPCKVYAGWPLPADLDEDLNAGKVHISVFPQPGERNTTRYPLGDWHDVGDGTLIQEVRRQERQFVVTVWAKSPDARKAVARVVDGKLATVEFLEIQNDYNARLIFRGSHEIDERQKTRLFRRDLFYSIEYATTERATAHTITQVDVGIAMQPDGASTPISNTTIHIT